MADKTLDFCVKMHDPDSSLVFGAADIYVDTITAHELEELTEILLKDRKLAANAVEGGRCQEGMWQEAVLLRVTCRDQEAAAALVRDTLEEWGYELREVNMVRQTPAEAARHAYKLRLLGPPL